MLIPAKKLIGCTIRATDGHVGEIKSFYFEAKEWTIRYLAVDAGGWMNSKQVLIPPEAITLHDLPSHKVNVNLTRDQIIHSPDVDFSLPIARSAENDVIRHYGITPYWEKGEGEIAYIPEEDRTIASRGNVIAVTDEISGTTILTERIPDAWSLFRSGNVLGYDLRAVDGSSGVINEFIIDDRSWKVHYLVADIGTFWAGKKVLLSPMMVDCLDQDDREVNVNLKRDVIRNSPEFDLSRPLDAELENRFREYYHQEENISPSAQWRFNAMLHAMAAGRKLRIELKAPALVRWSADEWNSFSEISTQEADKGKHIAEISTENFGLGTSVHFTFFWPLSGNWENKNFSVKIVEPAVSKDREPEMARV